MYVTSTHIGEAKIVKKPVPLGKPLELTDEQLDELSQLTPSDIEKAKAFWRNNAPAKSKTLLDAETMDDDKEKKK